MKEIKNKKKTVSILRQPLFLFRFFEHLKYISYVCIKDEISKSKKSNSKRYQRFSL